MILRHTGVHGLFMLMNLLAMLSYILSCVEKKKKKSLLLKETICFKTRTFCWEANQQQDGGHIPWTHAGLVSSSWLLIAQAVL